MKHQLFFSRLVEIEGLRALRTRSATAFAIAAFALFAPCLEAQAPPTLTKTFAPTSILITETSTLTFDLSTGIGNNLTGVSFTDPLPAGLVVATPNGFVGGCFGGTITAVAGSSTISLTNAAPITACQFKVNVTGITAGAKNNVTSIVTSNEAAAGAAARANLNVIMPPPPVFTKKFGAPIIQVNGTTTLTFDIGSGTPVNLTGVSFTDTLPAGLVVATPNGLNASCGGTVTAVPGSNSITLANGAYFAACQFKVDVIGTLPGMKNNITSPITTTQSGSGGQASASTFVVAPPNITKAFGDLRIPIGGITSLTLTISNPNALFLDALNVSDTLPAGLVVATPNGLSNTCGGTLTAVPGSGSIVLGSLPGTLVSNGSCTITVNVQGVTSGIKNNVTSNVTAFQAASGQQLTGAPATATLIVANPPTISKAFASAVFPINTNTNLTFTLVNPNTIPLTSVAFTDTLPAGLIVSGTGVISNSCGGILTAAALSSSISLANGIIPAGSCTIVVSITGTSAGIKTNVTSVISSFEGGNGNTTTATTIVALPPTISKALGVAVLPLNGVTTLIFTIGNPNAVTGLSGINFVDNLPLGLRIATPNGLVTTCTGAITAVAGSGSISLTAGTLAALTNCTITVNVTGVGAGEQVNITSQISSTEGGADGTATATITIGGNFLIGYAANLNAGDSVIDLTNTGANGASLTGPGFGGAAGNICMNVYAFSPDEQLVACCSCLVTPNGLVSLSANADLVSNTLTGVRPNSIVVKVVPTGASANFSGTSCTNSAAIAGNAANPLLVSGGLGFGTTIHAQGAGFATTENPLRQATLSLQELASITSRCTNIIGNGSTFGICRSCRTGGLNRSN